MVEVKHNTTAIKGNEPPYPRTEAGGEAGKAGLTMGSGFLPDPTEVIDRELSPDETEWYLKHSRFTDASGEMIPVGQGAYNPRRKV